nr:hypothetical protein [Tanacetum cinerariifolium]
MQTQTSNTLYNAIMEAGSKDRPTMLAPEWQRFVTLVKQSQELKTVSYHKLSQQAATRNRGKAIVNSPQPIYDQEPSMVAEDDETSKDKEIDKLMALISLSVHPEQSKSVHDTYPIEQDAQSVIIDSLDMSYDREEIEQNKDDNDLAKERELLASLIEKLKCEIDESKNRNKFLETSNNVLIKKLEELARRNSTEYASQMELECAK